MKHLMKYERYLNNFIEKWCIKNGIDFDDLSYLGSGDYGQAYSIGNDRVLKITNSKSEYDIAVEIQKSNKYKFISKVYSTEIFDGEMLIVLEELDIDPNIEDMFFELMNILDEHGLSLVYLNHLDLDEVEVSDDMEKFIWDLENIIDDCLSLGLYAPDISPYNLGYSNDGVLKAFDIDQK